MTKKPSIKWDDVSWSNTHLDTEDDQFHVGTLWVDMQKFVVVRLGSDQDDEPHYTILLDEEQAQDLAGSLRMEAR